MENYYNALAEVDAILDYLVEEDYNKIPLEIIDVIKENKNEDYIFEYDEELELKDQELLKETRAILYNLFRDYLATPEQKDRIKKWQREDRMKKEQAKINNYDYQDLFSKKETQENDIAQENQLMEYKTNVFYNIKNWFKNIFDRIKKSR